MASPSGSVGWSVSAKASCHSDATHERSRSSPQLAPLSPTPAPHYWLRYEFTTVLHIYPNGIRRYARRRILFSIRESDLFLHWDEIAQISQGDLGVRVGSASHPVIDLSTTSTVPIPLRTQHDADNLVAIMAHMLISESNTLFALLKHLHENPHDRKLVSEPSAAELLRPPPCVNASTRHALREQRRSHEGLSCTTSSTRC
ncbi:hypothetical protein EV641_103258 [Rhodococcus sp. SMB37]|nr:hypothetical protein EV641_103258 [Rhodococcus sp. SMB37]